MTTINSSETFETKIYVTFQATNMNPDRFYVKCRIVDRQWNYTTVQVLHENCNLDFSMYGRVTLQYTNRIVLCV